MDNSFRYMLQSLRTLISEKGYTAVLKEDSMPRSCSIDVDGSKYVGTITGWPNGIFEFQFNSCKTGDVVILETKRFSNDDSLKEHMRVLLEMKLL